MSRKIYLNKTDTAASAVDKIIKASDKEVILYIPREAEAAKTARDLQLLKREAEAAGKDLVIESVDEDVLGRISLAGIKANNPFLGRSRYTVSDIVRVKGRGSGQARRGAPNQRADASGRGDIGGQGRTAGMGGPVLPKAPKPRRIKKPLLIGGAFLLLVGLVAAALLLLPKATVAVTLEKFEHSFIGTLKVAPSIEESHIEGSAISLRGVVLTGEKNVTQKFPATGFSTVGRKAKGTITVYNAHGTEAQSLVKTTRFVTPDGKIFRLDNDVTIPGAKMESGKIVPSTIEVSVTSDQPGEEYNIGPVSKFRIPGFQGSAKYDGFYGESKSSMTGGSSGEVKVPTDEDLEKARQDAKRSLEEALKTEFLVNLESIKILDGAYQTEIIREQVDETLDEDNNFSFTLYGQIKLIGFNEDELVGLLRKYFEGEEEKSLVSLSYTVDYGEVTMDFDEEILSSAVNFESVWTRPFTVEEFKNRVAGMTENQLKEAVLSTPGVSAGEIRLWPFWVKKVPRNLDHIAVDVD